MKTKVVGYEMLSNFKVSKTNLQSCIGRAKMVTSVDEKPQKERPTNRLTQQPCLIGSVGEWGSLTEKTRNQMGQQRSVNDLVALESNRIDELSVGREDLEDGGEWRECERGADEAVVAGRRWLAGHRFTE